MLLRNLFRRRAGLFGERPASATPRPDRVPLRCEELEPRTVPSTGGGFSDGGLVGQYFPNPTFTGTPLFSRTDARIDFDWGASQDFYPSVSGSTVYPLQATNFSVKWTGQVIPRYSETYTFTTLSDDGVRLFVNGQTLIDDFISHSVTADSGSLALQAGQAYSIEMDYFQTDAQAVARLLWASPSTPQEVLSPAVPLGVNLEGLADWSAIQLFANAMLTSRKFGSPGVPWDGSSPVDGNGYPTQDFGAVVTDPPSGVANGTWALSFNGLASVHPAASSCTFFVNGFSYGSNLPSGAGYDPSTNTTTAQVVLPAQSQLMLAFTNTQRDASSATNTGLTGLVLMMPTSPGSSTPLPPSAVFNPAAEQLISHFTAIRYMDYLATNGNSIVNWSDRPTPGTAQYTLGQGGPLEYAVLLANETGKDLWINVPEQATDDYVRNMADLIAYGSDGVTPYTALQANGVFPGLEPNLKVDVEFSNEVWNYAFPQAHQNYNAAVAEVNAGGSPLNYDGSTDTYGWGRRRVGERTVQISNIFRGEFGDAPMLTRVRPVLEWQYANANNTAADALNFINNYYDNADGQEHVAIPHPVNYFVWGGGGGWYFGVNNSSGLGDVSVPNGSFEMPAVSDHQQDPTGATWAFSGPAGIAANGSSLHNPNAPDGRQAAYIQGNGSFTQTVTFNGGRADLSFHAAEGSTGSESFDIYFDGAQVGRDWRVDWTPDHTTFDLYHSLSFAATAGTHTIRFVGSGGNGVVFLDKVQVEDANAMYSSGLADSYATVAGDSQWAHAFGLAVTNYEGGFTIGGDYPTDLDKQANLDPRAQGFQYQGIQRDFQAGSDLAMIFDSSGYSAYGLASPNIYNQNTPKLQAIYQLLQQVPPTPNTGVALPATVGQQATIPEDRNYISPRPAVARVYMLQATTPGVYSVTMHGTQDSIGSLEHFLLDGQLVPGATSLPYWPTGAGDSSPALTFAITTPGLHGLALSVDGPTRIFLDGGNLTLTRVSDGIPDTLPPGWTDADVGSPSLAGSAVSYDAGNWIVTGGGSDIGDISDQFHFSSQPWSGDGSVLARVDSLTYTDPWAKAGVMFRDDTTASVVFAAVLATPGNGVAFQWRASTGGSSDSASVSGVITPVSLKLVRIGQSFSAFYSTDGSNWTQIGSAQTLAMSATPQAGLAVTAHNDGTVSTANFSNVTVSSSTDSVVKLSAFNFGATDGTELTQNASTVAGNVSAGAISRGSGLTASNQGNPPAFGRSMASVPSTSAGNTYGTDLAGAITKLQYYQFSIAAMAGHLLSLSGLSFAAWAQNGESTFGGGLQYSTDGVNFTTVSLTGSLSGASTSGPKIASADLSGVSALQGVSGTVYFRIYLFGSGPYTDTGLGRTSSEADLTVSGTAAIPGQSKGSD